MRLHHRKSIRTTLRRAAHSTWRTRWRTGDDLGEALAALTRAVRAHRMLLRLAPSFFDQAVIEREAANRAEQRRWMAIWERALAKVFGTAPEPYLPLGDLPPLPPVRTQRAVDRHLAARELWLTCGRTALERHHLRHPHAITSLPRALRMIELASAFRDLALGLNSPNPLPDKISYDSGLADLKRAYGHLLDQSPSASDGQLSVVP